MLLTRELPHSRIRQYANACRWSQLQRQDHTHTIDIPLAEQIFEDEYQSPYEFIDEHPDLVQFGVNGYVDLISHFECSQNYLGYLQFRFWVEDTEEATLALAVADTAIGWLNGEKVLEIEASGEGELMAPLWFPVKVHEGYNFLMLKIADLITPEQYRKAWGAKLEVFI